MFINQGLPKTTTRDGDDWYGLETWMITMNTLILLQAALEEEDDYYSGDDDRDYDEEIDESTEEAISTCLGTDWDWGWGRAETGSACVMMPPNHVELWQLLSRGKP